MQRVLITGGHGMLGTALRECRPDDCQLLVVDLEELDVAAPDAVNRCFAEFAPRVVIHCAAMTDVDGCERDPTAAERTNVQGTANVAAACGESVRLVHISTDFVFDGRARRPYHEGDPAAPVNVYGRTKLAAEERVRELAPNHAIARTAWTFAPWGRNFVRAILQAAREHGHLRVVDDQVGSPTYAPDSAVAIWQLAAVDARGVFHVVNSGVVSRHEFAREIVAAAGMAHVPVEPIGSADLAQPAQRPAFSALANTRLPALRPYREALRDCVARLHDRA